MDAGKIKAGNLAIPDKTVSKIKNCHFVSKHDIRLKAAKMPVKIAPNSTAKVTIVALGATLAGKYGVCQSLAPNHSPAKADISPINRREMSISLCSFHVTSESRKGLNVNEHHDKGII